MLLNNVTLFILFFLHVTIELMCRIIKPLLDIILWKFSKLMLRNSASMLYLEFVFVDQYAVKKK